MPSFCWPTGRATMSEGLLLVLPSGGSTAVDACSARSPAPCPGPPCCGSLRCRSSRRSSSVIRFTQDRPGMPSPVEDPDAPRRSVGGRRGRRPPSGGAAIRWSGWPEGPRPFWVTSLRTSATVATMASAARWMATTCRLRRRARSTPRAVRSRACGQRPGRCRRCRIRCEHRQQAGQPVHGGQDVGLLVRVVGRAE